MMLKQKKKKKKDAFDRRWRGLAAPPDTVEKCPNSLPYS